MNASIRGNAFVLDAQMRSSLAVIRSLGKAGIRVVSGDSCRMSLGFFSKYSDRNVRYPHPRLEEPNFIRFLESVLLEERSDVLIPVTDLTLMPTLKARDRLAKLAAIPFSNYSTVARFVDKLETIRIAESIGVDCPRTVSITSVDDIESVLGSIEFPVVAKPRVGSGSRGKGTFGNAPGLSAFLRDHLPKHGPYLVQEFIPPGGEEIGVYMLLNYSSELRGLTVHKRLRSYPVGGGPSTLRVTVDRPALISRSLELLQSIMWTGVAMVEFRQDPKSGKYYLMEVNPRFWGSLQLSILSGVDFPVLLFQLATQGDCPSTVEYRKGVYCRWLLPGDILHLLTTPKKGRALREFLRFRGMGYDDVSFDDPGPATMFPLIAFVQMFNEETRRLAFR